MPTYQYVCTECATPLEAVQKFTDDALTVCPTCGGKLRKVFSSVGVVFKGSGFYRTDSRSEAKSSVDAGGSASTSADSGSAASTASGGSSSTESGSSASSTTTSDSKSGAKSDGAKSDGATSAAKSDGGKSNGAKPSSNGGGGGTSSGERQRQRERRRLENRRDDLTRSPQARTASSGRPPRVRLERWFAGVVT